LVLDEEILLEIDKAGFRPALELIKTVPGIQQDSAVSVLAEVGGTRHTLSFPPPVISAPGPVCVQEIGGAREKIKEAQSLAGIVGSGQP
jgi:hypothetical protein